MNFLKKRYNYFLYKNLFWRYHHRSHIHSSSHRFNPVFDGISVKLISPLSDAFFGLYLLATCKTMGLVSIK